jgi:hypothetical protein
MIDKEQIRNDIEALIRKLESPLTQTDLECGWTRGAQEAMVKLLSEIGQDLRQGKKLPSLSLGRGLDHWGVEKGELLEEMCTLSNKLRGIGNVL